MRKIIFVFLFLTSVFFIEWGIKANTLVTRPDNLQDGKVLAWYESTYTAPNSDNEWYIDPNIPDNYIKMPGQDDVYLEVDESGDVIGYARRVKDGNGNWVFEKYDPNIPETYEKVDGLEDVYKVKDANGNVSYKKYIRNKDDNTFAFIDVDKNGKPINQNLDATTVDANHKLVDSNKNLYALYNDDGVKIGYQERVKDKKGNYKWKNVDPPKNNEKVGNDGIKQRADNNTPSANIDNGDSDNNEELHVIEGNNSSDTVTPAKPSIDRSTNNDGTYVETTTEITSKTKDGYKYTYQTVTKTTYNQDGVAIHVETEKPVQISKERIVGSDANPDKSQIAGSLEEELARVSPKVDFNTEKANELLVALNNERQEEGLPALKMDSSSEIYKVALIKAADMAIYNHGSTKSPLYGDKDDLIEEFDLSLVNLTYITRKASERSANSLHKEWSSSNKTGDVMLDENYGQVGIAVVDQDGETYAIEVFAQ